MDQGQPVHRVRVINGALVIDGEDFPTTGWTIRCEPGESIPTLTASLPLFDVSDDREMEVKLAYIASIDDPMKVGDVVGPTPQAALRALADRLDEMEAASA